MAFRDDEPGARQVAAEDELARVVDEQNQLLADVDRQPAGWKAEDERTDRRIAKLDRPARMLAAVALVVMLAIGLASKC
jgi:hypothetical protein